MGLAQVSQMYKITLLAMGTSALIVQRHFSECLSSHEQYSVHLVHNRAISNSSGPSSSIMDTNQETKSEKQVEARDLQEISHEELADPSHGRGDEALKVLDGLVANISEEEETQILRKIDWHLLPVLMLINAVQLIDKNVCNA